MSASFPAKREENQDSIFSVPPLIHSSVWRMYLENKNHIRTWMWRGITEYKKSAIGRNLTLKHFA